MLLPKINEKYDQLMEAVEDEIKHFIYELNNYRQKAFRREEVEHVHKR